MQWALIRTTQYTAIDFQNFKNILPSNPRIII